MGFVGREDGRFLGLLAHLLNLNMISNEERGSILVVSHVLDLEE